MECKVNSLIIICAVRQKEMNIDGNNSRQGGGDSSETESAPPADDDDEIMEDLRFCNEFMTKQQHSQTPQKQDESMLDDDFCLKYSGDEGITKSVCFLFCFVCFFQFDFCFFLVSFIWVFHLFFFPSLVICVYLYEYYS